MQGGLRLETYIYQLQHSTSQTSSVIKYVCVWGEGGAK